MKQMAKFEADLHCHTLASDGEFSAEEVVGLAYETGLKALAITDHDTIGSLEAAEKRAADLGLILVKGIEINTDGKEKEVHILGLDLNDQDQDFNRKLQELQAKRVARTMEILEKLRKLGMDIPYEEVSEIAQGDSVGRPHIAQAVVNHGYAQDFKEAFDKYLKIGAPAYVPRKKLTPELAIQIILEAGGVPVLAHPGTQISEEEIVRWIGKGLLGIEISHPDHTDQDTEKYKALAEKYRLLATGGSDFHGPGVKPEVELGQWGTALEIVAQIKQAKSRL